MDSGGRPGGVEAGHSEAWASKPADLERHWLGETEDAPKELLRTVQEPGEEAGQPRVEAGHSEAWARELADQGPGEEAGRPRPRGESSKAPRELVFEGSEHEGSSDFRGGNSSRTRHHAGLHRNEDRHKEAVEAERPRLHGASSEAPREQVLQGGEREGWPGSCKRAQRQVDLSWRAGTAVSKKRRQPSGSERSSEAKRRPAQFLSCKARAYGFVCQRDAAAEAAQGQQSQSHEGATPTAARKGESGDESDLLTEDRDRAGLRGSANRGSSGSQGWDPGGLLMGA